MPQGFYRLLLAFGSFPYPDLFTVTADTRLSGRHVCGDIRVVVSGESGLERVSHIWYV